jgi:hypothetical protein
MYDKPFDAEACDIGGQASATNGLSDMKTPSKTHCVIDPLPVLKKGLCEPDVVNDKKHREGAPTTTAVVWHPSDSCAYSLEWAAGSHQVRKCMSISNQHIL